MPITALSSSSTTHHHSSRGPFGTSDSFTIALQILCLQSGFYVILGISCAISVGALLGKTPTLASIFAAEPGHIEALPVVFAHVLTAPFTAILVGVVSGSASQVFDHVATLSTIHLILRIIIFRGFPSNVAFWAAVAFDAVVMVIIGEYIARRRELQALRNAVGSLNEQDDDHHAGEGSTTNNNSNNTSSSNVANTNNNSSNEQQRPNSPLTASNSRRVVGSPVLDSSVNASGVGHGRISSSVSSS